MQTPWDFRYAHRMDHVGSSVIFDLLKLTASTDIISFAGGLPAPEVFPVQKFDEACRTVLANNGPQALQYGATEGYKPLREMIVRHKTRFSVPCAVDNVMVTSGSQQALDLLGRVFLNRGDCVVVEAPTYLGALQAWNAFGAKYIAVPVDTHGMIVDELEKALRVGPKFIYVLPNFQNPSGGTLSLDRRRQLVALADKYGVPLIEDDPYGQLRYEGEHLPSLALLDSEHRAQKSQAKKEEAEQLATGGAVGAAAGAGELYRGNVIYLSTFSKVLAPGIRMAWVVASPEVIVRMVQAKQAADLHSSSFNQIVTFEVARGGYLDEHVKLIRKTYRERRDMMLKTMDETFPTAAQGVTWTRPEGGMFLWVTLPASMDATEVFKIAVKESKVAFVPGASFYSKASQGKNTFRLNFSYCKPDVIKDGMTRLGNLLKELIEATSNSK